MASYQNSCVIFSIEIWVKYNDKYSVSSLVVPKMEDEFSGTDAEKNSKWHDKSW